MSQKRKLQDSAEDNGVKRQTTLDAFVKLEPKNGTPKPASPAADSSALIELLTDPEWKKALSSEFRSDYFKTGVDAKLLLEKGKKIYPPRPLIFNAFNLTPFSKVKVVLIGQDPYINENQAHGLCFSVPRGTRPPPSLLNIYKELSTDMAGFKTPSHGCLERWAREEGILLLNASLTVRAGESNSHAKEGWEWHRFTNAAIKALSNRAEPLVFLLWGEFAKKKKALVDTKRHGIVEAAHPSPLSATRFFGCKCFSKVNEALKKIGKKPVDWRVD